MVSQWQAFEKINLRFCHQDEKSTSPSGNVQMQYEVAVMIHEMGVGYRCTP